jgi:DNA polymerase III delta prime subunit
MDGGIWNYLAGGAALGVIAGLWTQIKEVLWRVASLFVQRIEITSKSGHYALVSHLLAAYPRSRFYDRTYAAAYDFFRIGKFGLAPYEEFGERSLVFWNGWFPILFRASEPRAPRRPAQGAEAPTYEPVASFSSALLFIRGTFDFEAAFAAACGERNRRGWRVEDDEEKSKSRFGIRHVPAFDDEDEEDDDADNGLPWHAQGYYRLIGVRSEELGKEKLGKGRALEALVFPDRTMKLADEARRWRASREWYRDRGIPWKRGWLLYGPPGTGKTALARAFAEDLDLPIYVYNLALLSNRDLVEGWRAMQKNLPCIALIEDIDNVFHGREFVARRDMTLPLLFARRRREGEESTRDCEPIGPLTFDCLLNCIDGVDRNDGVFLIITTNDVDKIDPALGRPRTGPGDAAEFLSSRPGRIDKAIELGPLGVPEMKRLARRLLGDHPADLAELFAFLGRHPDFHETAAQFQERCAQIALARHWRDAEQCAGTAVLSEDQGRRTDEEAKVERDGEPGRRRAKAAANA